MVKRYIQRFLNGREVKECNFEFEKWYSDAVIVVDLVAAAEVKFDSKQRLQSL